jgi:serine/threonine protein kinase
VEEAGGEGTIEVGALVDGRYELVAFCAEGSFGAVWRARDTRFRDRAVAMKFLKPELMRRPEVAARFDTEAEALAVIEHPNVVAALDRGRWAGTRYLVLEWVDGITLDQWIQSFRSNGQRPPVGEALAIFEEVCLAVSAAHALPPPGPIVHRDLKPENVMLRTRSTAGSPSVKVLDFGIARLRGDGGGTRTGVQMGTFFYMAPEQATGASRAVGPWTDVFALGVVLIEALTGESEPAVETAWWTLAIRSEASVRDALGALLPGAPPALVALLTRCLRRDGADRFPDAGALLASFRETRASLSPSAFPPRAIAPQAAPPAPAPARSRTALYAALAALGVVGMLGVSLRARRTPSVAPLPVTVLRRPVVAPSGLRCPEGMIPVEGARLVGGLPESMRTPEDPRPVETDVAAFCIDRTEVTVAAWRRCVAAGGCGPLPVLATDDVAETPAMRALFSSLCVANAPGPETLAVNCVDALEAEGFCRWRAARLPSEAEWELAARGSPARPFPWGEAAPDAARLNACGRECVAALRSRGYTGPLRAFHDADDGAATVAPAGSYPGGATPSGVLDLAGNVAEWVRLADPGAMRGVRGGSWFSARPVSVHPGLPLRVEASHRNPQTGFRCASPPGARP